jgi:hypothetical protein
MSKQEFDVELFKDEDSSGFGFIVPFKVEQVYGKRSQVKVKGTIDNYPYRSSIAPMGNGLHAMVVKKEIREAIRKSAGDKVHVVMEVDTEERIVNIPDDFREALKKNIRAQEIFDKLSYTHRKEYVQWIESAKKPETRTNRIRKSIEKILEGINKK